MNKNKNQISLFERLKNKAIRTVAMTADGSLLKELNRELQKIPVDRTTRPILFFNASTRLEGISQNAAFSILTSLAIRAQGVPVVHFVCKQGMSRCVLGTNRLDANQTPPCRLCTRQSKRLFENSDHFDFVFKRDDLLADVLGKLGISALENFDYHDLPLGKLVLPSLRWVLRKHHLGNDEATKFLFIEFILSAWNVAQNFKKALEKYNPQSVIVFNGQFFPEATVRHIALTQGIRVISHEVAIQPFTCFFTDGEATAYPIDIPESFELSSSQNGRLDAYLEQRFQGNFSMAGIRFWPEMHSLGDDFWSLADKFDQIVPIFTNVVFDTSQSHANMIFSDMFAWLDSTLKIIKRHPETLFVIRAHPDEGRKGKESQESVAQWVQNNRVDKLENVLFVDSGEPFSSYELIQKSKFVMIYNSTIGLEASILGVPVLCAGKARFTQIKTVFLPNNGEDYERMAEKFLSTKKISFPSEFKSNARKFLYYQLYKTSLPYGKFLTPDRQWRGYVHLKKIDLQDLSLSNSAGLKTAVDGILKNTPFFLDE